MQLNEVVDLKGVGMALVGIPNQVRRHPEVGFGEAFLSSEKIGNPGNHVRGELRLNEPGGTPRRGQSQEGIGV
jgi:hypothetical protein